MNDKPIVDPMTIKARLTASEQVGINDATATGRTQTEITAVPADALTKAKALNDILGKAVADALNLLPPGGSVRKTVEAAYKAYLESKS